MRRHLHRHDAGWHELADGKRRRVRLQALITFTFLLATITLALINQTESHDA
jgi:hypothetical protein